MTIKMAVATVFAYFWALTHGVMAQALYPLPPQPVGLAWPGAQWEDGEIPKQTKAPLNALLDDAMARELGDVMGETRAIVIIHKGKLVAERYRNGFGPDTKQVSWSMAKSITSALVGMAVKRGMIVDLDAPLPGPWAVDDPRAAIIWRQWLNMTDGLEYHEIDAKDLSHDDVAQMMFGKGRYDAIAYAATLPLAHKPGTHWNYSTAGFHLLSKALQGLLSQQKPEAMVDYANAVLFDPIGMNARIEFDPAGTFMGGSSVWASARDFARFGYLYLRDGVWDGQRVLPEGWVDFSRSKSPADNVTVYGAGWWINAANADDIRPKGQGSALGPRDAFSARGHEGQIIWVVPSRDLVIVRLGLMGNGGQNWPVLYDWAQKITMEFPEQ
jgi:CubicO group peptidase (beta-lactamase class C family)